MLKTGIHYLLENGLEYEDYTIHDLVYWCPFENRLLVGEEVYNREPLAVHVYSYLEGRYYLTYDWDMGGKEVSVFVNKEGKIYGIGARTDKDIISSFINWYRENGDSQYNEWNK